MSHLKCIPYTEFSLRRTSYFPTRRIAATMELHQINTVVVKIITWGLRKNLKPSFPTIYFTLGRNMLLKVLMECSVTYTYRMICNDWDKLLAYYIFQMELYDLNCMLLFSQVNHILKMVWLFFLPLKLTICKKKRV